MGLFGKKKNPDSDGSVDDFTVKMMENSKICVEHFKDKYQNKLDFSEKSLELIEEILDEASEFLDQIPQQQKSWIINILGSYVFEVARKYYGGKYYMYDERHQPILVTGQPDFEISILVFDKIVGRLENGKEDNIPFFFQGYSERVKNAKKGDMAMIV